ncbi:MAG: UvrD-helicase domain-containing protein [Mycoplasmataceae bacterium]|nr:UvrD-helicase domain-containing protein [Mycoplasmataceae bacterium]
MYLTLNENQLKAVNETEGPVRIIAGPGSGKTRTIISKITHILSLGLAQPHEILTISFTNKSANEIKERIAAEQNNNISNVYTYHGWCNYFLRMEAEAAGLNKDFTIIDSGDSKTRINNLIKENGFSIEKHDAIDAFDRIAREEIKVDTLLNSNLSAHTQIAKLWEKYRNDKRTNGQLDFNDLIIEVKDLLIRNSEISEKWKNKYKYIFIDEFQDTNNVQFEILKSLTNKDSNITVVGDPNQNIYSWRGANIDLINNFEKWYPTAKTIMLNINYRSTPEIIQASNSLIKNNKNRVKEFEVIPIKLNSSVVEIIEKENDMEEAWTLIKEINKLKSSGYLYHDIAIIVRSSFKTKPLEIALNYHNIPYKVIGAMKFFERREVKQTMKFLLFSVKQDNSTLLDIINEPPKKFGPQKILKVKFAALDAKQTMWEYLCENPSTQSEPIQKWIDYTKRMINSISKGEDVVSILGEYLDDIGYMNRLFDEPSRIENIKETLKLIRVSIRKNNKSIKETIIEFYNNSNLSSSSDKSIEEGEVNIITAHASKGTEFPIVFLFSMVEGHWPSSKAIERGDIEEERRVAYVAMTRAMNKLFITVSNGLTAYNKELEQSRFINEFLTVNTYNYIDTNIKKPRCLDVEYENDNEKSSKIGNKIFHNTFGKGEIIHNDGEFITIKFDDGKKQEILLGHKSYKVIKW